MGAYINYNSSSTTVSYPSWNYTTWNPYNYYYPGSVDNNYYYTGTTWTNNNVQIPSPPKEKDESAIAKELLSAKKKIRELNEKIEKQKKQSLSIKDKIKYNKKEKESLIKEKIENFIELKNEVENLDSNELNKYLNE